MVHRFEADHDLSGRNYAEGAELLQIQHLGRLAHHQNVVATDPQDHCLAEMQSSHIGPAPV